MVTTSKTLSKLASWIALAWNFANHEDVRKFARGVWEHLVEDKTEAYTDDSASIVSRALHRMNTGRSPRIALVGMTSAGKSSLVNALFGVPIAEVRRTPDTTSCILEVTFPSGLVIYDTPGIAGAETYENITRAFLGIPQDSDIPRVDAVPLVRPGNLQPRDIELLGLRDAVPLPDVVLFVVDASRTLTRPDKKALTSFYLQLASVYPGRLVAAGSHYDELSALSEEERNAMLASFRDITSGTLVPVSATTGTGMSELVLALFQALPESVALSKVQESLRNESRLGRLAYVISEASGTIAEMSLLKGNQRKDIQIATMYLFASICRHFDVDEATWMKHNGNVLAIGEAVRREGDKVLLKVRDPKTLWERIRSVFSDDFLKFESHEYEEIGPPGIAKILPGVYRLIYELSAASGTLHVDRVVEQRILARAADIRAARFKNNRSEIQSIVRTELGFLLDAKS